MNVLQNDFFKIIKNKTSLSIYYKQQYVKSSYKFHLLISNSQFPKSLIS